MFNLNFDYLYEIDINPTGTASYKRIGKGISGVTPSLNEVNDQTKYLDGDGFGTTTNTGAQQVFAFTGHRYIGDEAQDFIFGTEFNLGTGRDTKLRVYDPDGNLVSMSDCTIANITQPNGDAGSKAAVSFEIHVNGKPVKTAKSIAAALTATVAVGVAIGSTKFTATPAGDNTLAYKLLSATAGNVYGDSLPVSLTAYTSGADIAATAGQFLQMYELSPYGRVAKYAEAELAGGDIKS